MANDLSQYAREVSALWQGVRAIAGEDDQAVLDTMEGETGAIDALRWAVRRAIEAEQHADACKQLAASYRERSKALEDRAERYRVAVANFMQEVGEKTLRLPEGTISWRVAAPQILGAIPSAKDLPDSCVKLERRAHEPSIKAVLSAGVNIHGLSLSNGGVSLTIRRA